MKNTTTECFADGGHAPPEIQNDLAQLAQYRQLGTPEEIAARIAASSTRVIDCFAGEDAFLSNFHPCAIVMDELLFTCVEEALQAAKCSNAEERQKFVGIGPREAKKRGRRVALRPDWETVKIPLMRSLVLQKFSRNTDLRRRLLETGDARLVEGNTWHDNFWGICACKACKGNRDGKNHLGRILVEVRTMLRLQEYPKEILLPNGNILSVSAEDTHYKTGVTVQLMRMDGTALPLMGVYHRQFEEEPHSLTAEFLHAAAGLRNYHFGQVG